MLLMACTVAGPFARNQLVVVPSPPAAGTLHPLVDGMLLAAGKLGRLPTLTRMLPRIAGEEAEASSDSLRLHRTRCGQARASLAPV
jgi:hypothetical protein